MTQKILITGATGFTGRALARRLLDQGENLVIFARHAERLRDLTARGADVREVDIADEHEVRNAFEQFKIVYHIAAAFRTEHDDLSAFRTINVDAVSYMLKAAQQNNTGRFVHCSTVGVQGEIDDPPADESYRFKPGDHYQQTKLEGEILARRYFAGGLPGTVIRPVGIYGPGDLRFLKLFRPISRGRFVMIGRGTTLYHLTHIDDLVDGFILAGHQPAALGETFTIGGPVYTTLNELVACIAECTGGRLLPFHVPYAPVYLASVACAAASRFMGLNPALYPRRVEFFSKSRAFSIDKAKRLLGYQPKIGLREGLLQTAAWYREQGYLS